MLREKLEEEVLKNLIELNIDLSSHSTIGIAVSGGADSVSLLFALKNLSDCGFILKVITVNHNLREKNETEGDASFVEKLCKENNIFCKRYDIEKGKIFDLSERKKSGIEDAARKLRYECFEDFIKSEKIDYLALAHNKNDLVETIMMRIFQASNLSGLKGIPLIRDKFIRPLITVSRDEIESYLKSINQTYRTDSTNLDNNFLRNKFRNQIIPFLKEHLDSVEDSILTLSKKLSVDNDVIENLLEKSLQEIEWKKEDESVPKISFNLNKFNQLELGIKIRVLYKSIEQLIAKKRISYNFIRELIDLLLRKNEDFDLINNGLFFSKKKNFVYILKNTKLATEKVFFVIIEEDGTFYVGDKRFSVSSLNGSKKISCEDKILQIDNITYPFVFRSRQSGDFIKTANDSQKSVSKVLEDWKCMSYKDDVPIIHKLDDKNHIVCIWGGLYDFPNWIVKD